MYSSITEQEVLEDSNYLEDELVNLALKVDNQNNLLNKVRIHLDAIEKTGDIRQLKALRLLISRNIEHVSSSEDMCLIRDNFRMKLKSAYPQLSANDIKLAGFIRLNYTTKQIADILCIKERSVEVKRYRLRHKMNLTEEQKLSTLLELI